MLDKTFNSLCKGTDENLFYSVYFERDRLCYDVVDAKRTNKEGMPMLVKGLCKKDLVKGGKDAKKKAEKATVKELQKRYCGKGPGIYDIL